MSVKKKILGLLIAGAIVGLLGGYVIYGWIFSPNTDFDTPSTSLTIPKGSSYGDVAKIIQDSKILKDFSSFDQVAGWMKYKKKLVPSGKFVIYKDWSNKKIISLLRAGLQTPVSLTFNNVRTMTELAAKLSQNIGLDSSEIAAYLLDPQTAVKYGYSAENFMCMFIPNTYKVFWDISPEELTDRIKKEHDAFWNKKHRKDKAKALDLATNEVYILASIVEKESQYGPERPTIAGLYLNRLKRGILLQADPTVVFASGKFDLRRVLNKHIKIDSPYNTYLYPGLPPGPIYMPSIQSIDAVLNPEKHKYLYMCAKPGFKSKHAFASTLKEHNNNANKYRRWLSKQKIR